MFWFHIFTTSPNFLFLLLLILNFIALLIEERRSMIWIFFFNLLKLWVYTWAYRLSWRRLVLWRHVMLLGGVFFRRCCQFQLVIPHLLYLVDLCLSSCALTCKACTVIIRFADEKLASRDPAVSARVEHRLSALEPWEITDAACVLERMYVTLYIRKNITALLSFKYNFL